MNRNGMVSEVGAAFWGDVVLMVVGESVDFGIDLGEPGLDVPLEAGWSRTLWVMMEEEPLDFRLVVCATELNFSRLPALVILGAGVRIGVVGRESLLRSEGDA